MSPLIAIILLLVAGLALFVLEAILPGGIVGIVGALLIGGSVVLCVREYGWTNGMYYLVGSGLLALFTVGWSLYLALRRMALTPPEPVEPHPKEVPESIGRIGEVLQPLDPSGVIRLDGGKRSARLNPSSDRAEKGEQVRVMEEDGFYLVVEKVEGEEEA